MQKKWYIIQTVSGFENKVKQMIFDRAVTLNMIDLFGEVIIPSISVTEIKRGKKVDVEKKFMPGYLFVQMNMTDEAWHLIKNIPKVNGLLGNDSKPKPISEQEVKRLLDTIDSEQVLQTMSDMYGLGESIIITEGPFESFSGKIEDIDNAKQKARVLVSIFGRETPIDLTFEQIKKQTN